jgi:hypothetical protein
VFPVAAAEAAAASAALATAVTPAVTPAVPDLSGNQEFGFPRKLTLKITSF